MGLSRLSTFRLFSAQLTLARQSETLRPITALGGRNDAGQHGGNIGGFCRQFCTAHGRNEGANRAAGDADGAAVAACRHRGVGAAPYPTADDTPASLSTVRVGTRRLSPLQ